MKTGKPASEQALQIRAIEQIVRGEAVQQPLARMTQKRPFEPRLDWNQHATLRTVNDHRWKQVTHRFFQQIFLNRSAQLELWWKAERSLHDRPIEQRRSSDDTERRADGIHFVKKCEMGPCS
jgi:hypothetical protein